MTKRLNIGFIGGAYDSAVGNTHRIASQMDGRWQLSSGCFSKDGKANRTTAELWLSDNARVYQDWRSFLQNEQGRIDAVAVLTPTPSHAEIVKQALDSGYAVICEKALTSTVEQSLEIGNSAYANDGFLAVTYNYSGYPMLRELKLMIERGELGKVNQIHIEMPQEGFLRFGADNGAVVPQQWRLQDGLIPTLSLDLGVHVHHIIKFLTAERPLEVVSLRNTFGHFGQVVDNMMCMARYSNNIDCQIWFSKSALGHSNGLKVRVYGQTGSAQWYQMNPEGLELFDNKGNRHILERSSTEVKEACLDRYNRFKAGHPAGFLEAFANYYYDLADAVIAKGKGEDINEWCFGVEDATEGLAFLSALELSANDKCWHTVKQV